MAFFNRYPYTDFHDLNLDWIISKIKEIKDSVIAASNSADAAADSAEAAANSAEAAADSAEAAADSAEDADDSLTEIKNIIEFFNKQNTLRFDLYEGNDHLILRLEFETFEFKESNTNVSVVSSINNNKFVTNGGLSFPIHKYSDEEASDIEYGSIYTTGTGIVTIKNGILNYTTDLTDTTPDVMIPSYPAIRLNNANYDFSSVQDETVTGLNQYVSDYVLNRPHNRLIIAQRSDDADIQMFIIFGRTARWPGPTNNDLQTIFRNYKTAVMLDGGGSVQLGFNGAQLLPNQNRSLTIRNLPNVCILGG